MSQCFNSSAHLVLQSCFCCSRKKIDIISKHTKTTIWGWGGGGGGMGMLLSVTYWPACVTMTTLFFPVSSHDFASIHKKFRLKKDLNNGFSFSFFFFSLLLISWNTVLHKYTVCFHIHCNNQIKTRHGNLEIWNSCSCVQIYRKIPEISPRAYIFQRPFLRGLFLEGLIFRGAHLWREIYDSKSIGLAL